MIIMEILVACNTDGIIGCNNNLPWYLPEDMKRFRELTVNNVVIMGRKTFESMGRKPLKDRVNIIITNQNYENKENLIFCNMDNIYKILENYKNMKHYVIGGSDIYKLFYDKCNVINMTIVYVDVVDNNIIKFPYKCESNNIIYSSELFRSKNNNIMYKYIIYNNGKKS
jgi:dihydrofolate reductase